MVRNRGKADLRCTVIDRPGRAGANLGTPFAQLGESGDFKVVYHLVIIRHASAGEGGGVLFVGEEVVDGGGDDQRQGHGDQQAADDGDGERLEHLGAGTEGEGQGQHAGHSGEGSHDDGAETAAGGLDHGVAGAHASGAEALIGVEEQDAVFGDDADDHDQSHEGRDVEVVPVRSSAKMTPAVERTEETRMAAGAEKLRNSARSTPKTRTRARRRTCNSSWNDCCCC